MNKTKIPWADYSINPVKGLCPVNCKDNQGKSYCYARRMYKRFKWMENVHWHPPAWDLVDTLRKPSRIFVGSTFELFHASLPENWMEYNLLTAKKYSEHTFIFLTKQPQNLAQWSPFPENCWVGVSVTDELFWAKYDVFSEMADIRAGVKFISFEPLLSKMAEPYLLNTSLKIAGINWVIIGSRTQPTRHPPKIWVDEIISAADKAKIPVFIKEPLASHYGINRQEFPVESVLVGEVEGR